MTGSQDWVYEHKAPARKEKNRNTAHDPVYDSEMPGDPNPEQSGLLAKEKTED